MREAPRHLAIIGAGPIGVEMAQAHQRLGCQVTLIEAQASILPRDDAELSALLAQQLRADGVEVTHTNYDGMVHVFFQLGPICDASARSVTEVATAARDALRS